LYFTPEEQIVLAYKFLSDLKSRLYRQIDWQSKRFIGNINLCTTNELAVCKSLGCYYDRHRGARSIAAALANVIEPKIVAKYMKVNQAIKASQPVENYLLDVDGDGFFLVTCESDEAT
jgi:hypothetical protein